MTASPMKAFAAVIASIRSRPIEPRPDIISIPGCRGDLLIVRLAIFLALLPSPVDLRHAIPSDKGAAGKLWCAWSFNFDK